MVTAPTPCPTPTPWPQFPPQGGSKSVLISRPVNPFRVTFAALEPIGFLLGAEASSVPRASKSPCSALFPVHFTAILATARQRLGGTWACEVFLTLFRQVCESQSPVTDPKQRFGRVLCLQPCFPFIFNVTPIIGAGASITSRTSKPLTVSLTAPGYRTCPLLGACGVHLEFTFPACALLALGVHVS